MGKIQKKRKGNKATSNDPLIQKAIDALDSFNPNTAILHLGKALKKNPKNCKVLELLGTAYMDLLQQAEDFENTMQLAKDCFNTCILYEPNESFQKYFYLAQLLVGTESLECYLKGMEILENELNNKNHDLNEHDSLKEKAASTLCAMVELYMTDLCDDIDAEQKCQEYLNKALQYKESNPEVFQTYTSFLLSQNKPEEAQETVLKSMEIWFRENHEEMENVPEYNQRIALVKLLMELSLNEKALKVLETLQEEDDENAEMWYLYGWCYYLNGGGKGVDHKEENAIGNGGSVESKNESWDDCRDCLRQIFNLNEKYPGLVDEEILAHSQQIFIEVNSFLEQNGIFENDEVVDDNDEENWEDESDMDVQQS
ncbi:hypothetical protein HDU92_002837 [Lobulomyces angularis]|nr:hypothetical protein HDU92_002837 [Lobulomyces angularis]